MHLLISASEGKIKIDDRETERRERRKRRKRERKRGRRETRLNIMPLIFLAMRKLSGFRLNAL